jgi:hypothetical protein
MRNEAKQVQGRVADMSEPERLRLVNGWLEQDVQALHNALLMQLQACPNCQGKGFTQRKPGEPNGHATMKDGRIVEQTTHLSGACEPCATSLTTLLNHGAPEET